MTAVDVAPVRPELFGRGRRATTVGLLLITLVTAFEAMGVGTALPAVIADLGAVSAYAWPIATFLAASVLGTVLGGRFSDARGPRATLLLGPVVFGVGLVVAGTSGALLQLLVGRVLQGLGAGALMIAGMVTIAAVYPERARPAVFGLISGAWVLPSLVGPPLAGFVTERWSWHWVFLGLVPVVVLALALVVPAARRLTRPEHPAPARPGLVAAAAGAAAGVTALTWAAQRPNVLGAGAAVGALAVLVPSLHRLLPAGVFRSPARCAGGRGRSRPARGRVLHRQLLRPADAHRHARLVADRRRRSAGDGLARVDCVVGLAGPPPRRASRDAAARRVLPPRRGHGRAAPGRGRVGPGVARPARVDAGRRGHGCGLLRAVVPAAAALACGRGRREQRGRAARRPAHDRGAGRRRRRPAGAARHPGRRPHHAAGAPRGPGRPRCPARAAGGLSLSARPGRARRCSPPCR